MKQVILHVIGWLLWFFGFGLLGSVIAALFIVQVPYAPKPTVRVLKTYNVLRSGTNGIAQYKGHELRSNGMCVEIWLNGRIDTIVCGSPVLVTETEETTGKPEASVTPAGPAMQ